MNAPGGRSGKKCQLARRRRLAISSRSRALRSRSGRARLRPTGSRQLREKLEAATAPLGVEPRGVPGHQPRLPSVAAFVKDNAKCNQIQTESGSQPALSRTVTTSASHAYRSSGRRRSRPRWSSRPAVRWRRPRRRRGHRDRPGPARPPRQPPRRSTSTSVADRSRPSAPKSTSQAARSRGRRRQRSSVHRVRFAATGGRRAARWERGQRWAGYRTPARNGRRADGSSSRQKGAIRPGRTLAAAPGALVEIGRPTRATAWTASLSAGCCCRCDLHRSRLSGCPNVPAAYPTGAHP